MLVAEFSLSADQVFVHDAVVEFSKSGKFGSRAQPFMTIGGYAGVGKSTTVAHIVKTLEKENKSAVFCCFTGKASSVLREKLDAQEVDTAYCGTIHSMIYDAIVEQGKIVGFELKQASDIEDRIGGADLIFVDEASMVNEDVWNDLLSLDIPIVAVGDHGQLPPVGDKFNLMEKPDLTLTKIHRQAQDNPIIKLSVLAREEGEIPFGHFGRGVYKASMANDAIIKKNAQWMDSTLFLCGINRTRKQVNNAVRRFLGFDGDPKEGERVICLKNNRRKGIYNGVLGRITSIDTITAGDLWTESLIEMDDGTYFDGSVFIPQFGAEATLTEYPGLDYKQLRELFDFGYCLTVHKSQGSEADSVVLFEERNRHMDDDQWRRWLYTGVTRAKKFLTIINRRFDKR